MAGLWGPLLAAVLLLVSSGVYCSSSSPACLQSCTCQRAPLLNCSSSGLSSVPRHIQDSVTELDLSHNLLSSAALHWPHWNLKNVWLGNNTITHLSLCIERNHEGQYFRGRHRFKDRSRRGCVSWAPTLQLLSVERNQLEQVPEGLEGVKSLQVLQLSFNRISTLQPGVLSHLQQLKELHLQHNLITSLHPQMFQDLVRLRVLDLSYNMLASLHPLIYFNLHSIGTNVRLGGNRWQCDCSMRSLRRRMAYDSSRGLQAWSMVCASPSVLSGRDLLHLEEDDLHCFTTKSSSELHQDVTVYTGSEIILSCSTQDSLWWMPNGQTSVSHQHGGLHLTDITEGDTGLYVCVSENHQVVSVFNLQISKIRGERRKPRSLPRTSQQIIPEGPPNTIGNEKNQNTGQSNLALAVCLSVFITFLVAFILGVIARPYIDVLCKMVTNKKRSSAANSVSSVEQRQYDNEAYSNGEDPEEIETCRERRVTFSSVENIHVEYYDTVASGDQETITDDAVFECEAAETEKGKHTAGDSESMSSEDEQNSSRDLSSDTNTGHKHSMEFEHIPDPDEMEERRSLSSSSDSSLSEKVSKEEQLTKGDQTTPKSSRLVIDFVQQKGDFPTAGKVEAPEMFIECRSEIPEFSSEPFADWSPHTNNRDPTHPDHLQENEELFEFSDSVQSSSPRSSSVFGSFNQPKQSVSPILDNRDESSSSSSYISDDEPTQYTVNYEQGIEHGDSFEQQIHNTNPARPSVVFNGSDQRYDRNMSAVRPDHSFSSDSSDSETEPVQHTVKRESSEEKTEASIKEVDKLSGRTGPAEEDTRLKVIPMPRTKWRGVSLGVASHTKIMDTRTSEPPATHSSSSSSESETEVTDLKVEHNKGSVNNITKHLEISPASRSSDSSSSSDSEEETITHKQMLMPGRLDIVVLPFQESLTKTQDPGASWPAVDLQHIPRIKRRLDIKASSLSADSSSSSDSEEETTHISNREQGELHMSRIPVKVSQTVIHEPEPQWTAPIRGHATSIKRRLDIKAPSPSSGSSSSSDSEDETKDHTEKQGPGRLDIAVLPFQESKTKRQDPGANWPAVDLRRIPRIKRRLDIKAPSLSSDSSSSSDSENETTQIKKHKQQEVHIARPQTEVHNPETQWPLLDLQHTTSIKRRLDIKAPSPASDSSSSSDSDNETITHIEKHEQQKVHITGPQTDGHSPKTHWPLLDLQHTSSIKKRLDIKAPSPASDSSSSSDSEDETTDHMEQQGPGRLNIAVLPFQESKTKRQDPGASWPAVDLRRIPRIKRRLDIKAPSLSSDSSSSSDSEYETTTHIKKHEQQKVHNTGPQTDGHSPKTHWPLLDLQHTSSIKKRLDIKAPSPASDSSSSSDSEDETTDHTEKQGPGRLDTAVLPFQESTRKRQDPDASWPAVDLRCIPRIKRRLDIKAPSPSSGSSSSSDSEDETKNHMEQQGPGRLDIAVLPFQESKTKRQDPGASWPAVDLRHIPRIKRSLDIKAPSLSSDSSSSSDSEYETTTHIKKHEQQKVHITGPQTDGHSPKTHWPLLDLQHTSSIKKRLDIKAPSPASDSSSSSDSEDETKDHMEQQGPGRLDIAVLPFQESKTKRQDPGASWPAVDLRRIPRNKRRLDIKAPSPSSSSSSSDDSEDETTHIKKQQEVHTARPQTEVHSPKTQWPLLDLQHTTSIKKRLDIKALSPSSGSSSSSDSGDETKDHMEKQGPGRLDIAVLPFQESKTKRQDPDASWPAVDLRRIPHIKRRLDIKAPSLSSDSSSSSDSENETKTHKKKHKQQEVHIARPQTEAHNPETQWPLLDLQHTTSIKRRLDIKTPSPASDSSSSSDSDNETTTHIKRHEQQKVHITRPQTDGHSPKTHWPLLDLQHTSSIKKRLDIKAPSPSSGSSSSSDSEDETTDHTEKQGPGRLDIAVLPFQESKTKRQDPGASWPAVDLRHIPRIKRRLDIKAPSPSSSSSSSDDSENETTQIKKHEQQEVHIARPQTEVHNPETQWPLLDLQHTTSIKRRLDIKTPSPASDSSSSSDSDNETTTHIEKHEQQKVHITGPQTDGHSPKTHWPLLDLQHTSSIKKRLDIKAPSPASDSSSSSDTEDETKDQTEKQGPGRLDIAVLPFQESKTKRQDTGASWPAVDLQRIPLIKRRLDIKAPSPSSGSSSSSDSEDETKNHMEQQGPGRLDIAVLPFQESKTKRQDPGASWPAVDLRHIPRIKRRLDIKAPSLSSDSSSSSDSDNETTTHIKKHEQQKVHITGPQTDGHSPKTHWPLLDLQHTSSIKKRLDIKAPSPASDSSSSSDSEDETKDHTGKQGSGRLDIAVLPFQESTRKRQDPGASWPAVDLRCIPRIKRRLDIKAASPSSDSCSSSDTEDQTTTHIIKQKREEWHMTSSRRLDVKTPSVQPDVGLSRVALGSRQSKSNSSSSESEDENRDHKTDTGMGVSVITTTSEKKFTTSRSPKTDHDIKLEKYTAISNELKNKPQTDVYSTPEINPELQSRWATMTLGISRFRKRLEITSHSHEPPNLSSSPPPDSSHSSSSESSERQNKRSKRKQKRKSVGLQEITVTDSSLILQNKPVNVSQTLMGEDINLGKSVEVNERSINVYSFSATEAKSTPDTVLVDFGTPHIERYLDGTVSEKAPTTPHLPKLKDSSSSSNSEDEIHHSVPDLSLRDLRIKRRLNITAPSPEPSNSTSSSSESESEVTKYTATQGTHVSNMSGITDNDSLITYKRLIIKASSPPSNSISSGGTSQIVDRAKQTYTEDEKVTPSLSPRRVPNMNSDDVIKKKIEQPRPNTDVDVPPEIRWTGVGHHLSYLSTSAPSRSVNAALTYLPTEPGHPPPDYSNSFSSKSDIQIKQLMQKYPSLSANIASPASSGTLDKVDNSPSSSYGILRAVSEGRSERKGLNALKAMSSERQKWDREVLDKGAYPLSDDHGSHDDTDFSYHKPVVDTKPLPKQLQSQIHNSSASTVERSGTDLLYGVPRYWKHYISDTEPPQEAPPPVPATPPPYEAVELTWRSSQSNKKLGWEENRSNQQQRRNTEESDSSSLSGNIADVFDYSNPISHV